MNKNITKFVSLITVSILLHSAIIVSNNNTINKAHAESFVCSLNDGTSNTNYESVFEALKKASETGGTVSLSSNFEEYWSANITLKEDVKVVFDLNGYTYSETLNDGTSYHINVFGCFEINDSSANKTGKWVFKDSQDNTYERKLSFGKDSSNGVINILNGNISNFESFIFPANATKATVNISGGVFDEPIFKFAAKDTLDINISGGNFLYDPTFMLISNNQTVNYNLKGNIKNLSIYCLQSLLATNQLNISVTDTVITQSQNPILFYVVHNESKSIDGLKLLSFKPECNKYLSSFSFQILDNVNDAINSQIKASDYKLTIMNKKLLIKEKDFINPEEIEDKKIEKADEFGNKLTFIGTYSDADKIVISGLTLNVTYLSISDKYKEMIGSSSIYSSYRIVNAINVKVIDSEGNHPNLENKANYYLTFEVSDDYKDFDKFVVVDEGLNKYVTTYSNGYVTFATNGDYNYIILAKGEIKIDYVLGAIIPLTIILGLEILFILGFYIRKMIVKKINPLASISMLGIFLLTELWGGAIPIIIIESILIIGLGVYIFWICKKEFF